MHRQGKPPPPVFQNLTPRKPGAPRTKDPEKVAEYIELIESFRESLEDQIQEMNLLLILGRQEGTRTLKQDIVQFLRQMDSDLTELNEIFSEVGWGNIVGLHPAPEKVWPSDLKREAERAEAVIMDLFADFKKMWKSASTEEEEEAPPITLQQRLETFNNALHRLEAEVQTQKKILNKLKYTDVELYNKRQDYRESMNESIREAQTLRQAAVEAGATLWDFKDVATEKELKKFHQTQNQILEDVMIQKATQRMEDQQKKAGKIIASFSNQAVALKSRTKENRESYLRALKDYNETLKRLLRSLSVMFREEAEESEQKYIEEIDEKLQKVYTALSNFFRGTWNMIEAKKLLRNAHAQNLEDIQHAISKTKLAPPPPPPKEVSKEKGIQITPPPLFQAYIDEWDEYAAVLDGQVARMEPFSLFRKPSRKERELGTAQAQADSFQSDRNEMLEIAIENWEQAKQDPDVAPWLNKKNTSWSLFEINLSKTKVDTMMKEFLRLHKIIQKGESSASFVARLGRIGKKAVELGAAAENVVTRFSTMFQGNPNIAQLLDIIGLQTPVKSARKFVHRLEKETQRLGNISKTTRKKKFTEEYLETLKVVQKAAKAVSKQNHAKLMNESTGVGKKDSIHDVVFGTFAIFEKEAKKIADSGSLVDSEKRPQLQNILNQALDLLEISRRPAYRLYGYDPSQDTGINVKERKREIQEKIELVTGIGKMLKDVGGGGKKKKKKKKSKSAPPVITILTPRKKPKKIPPPLLSSEEIKNTFPDPIVLIQVSSPVPTICDIMPTLANTVIPMARYETVRIQVRRRAPAHAGVTDRIRKDMLFITTDSLRKNYRPPPGKEWPVNAKAMSGLDEEIYRRVFARQLSTSQYLGKNFTTKLLEKEGEDKTNEFKNFLKAAADPEVMRASMGTDIFTGNSNTVLTIKNTMIEGTWLEDVVMGYILRVYLGVGKYDRSVVIEPLVWHETALEVSNAIKHNLPDRPAKWWLAAEIFQYKIPAEALPLGTDASDKILLNQCGISLVLFILNQEQHHWTLLAYPVRRRPDQRKLYHYDSQGIKNLETTHKLTQEPHVRLVEGGLFDSHIFDKDNTSGRYKYFTTPGWEPRELGCKQPHGWECGYMAVGLIDVLCRKTEANPDSMSNPQNNTDPLQIGDIPVLNNRNVEGSLATYMNDFLEKARQWTDDVAGNTVWRIQEPDASYGDKRGAPDLLAKIRPQLKLLDEAARLEAFKRRQVSEGKAKKLIDPDGVCGLSRGKTQTKYNTWASWDLGNGNYLHCVFGVVGELGPDGGPATVAAQAFPEILRNIFHTKHQSTSTDDDEEKRGFKTSVHASIAALDLEMFTNFVAGGGDRTKHLWYENGLVCVCAFVSHAWIHLFNVGSAEAFVVTRATRKKRRATLEISTAPTAKFILGNFSQRMDDPINGMLYPTLAVPPLPGKVLHTSRREKKNGGSTILLATPELFKLGFLNRIPNKLLQETKSGVTSESCAKYFPNMNLTFMIVDATSAKDATGKTSVFPIHLGNDMTKWDRKVSYLSTSSQQHFWC